MLVNHTTDKPIRLCSDNQSRSDGSNFDVGQGCCMVDSGQPGSGAFISGHPPMLSNRTASEHEYGDVGIHNTKSPQTAKRLRPWSSIPPHTRTPPHPHNENVSRVNIDRSDSDPGDGDSWSKRRILAAQPDGRTASNSLLQRSTPPNSEEDEDNGTLGSSPDSSAASTARTTPASESAPPAKPQLCLELSDANQDWEVRQIIGREDVDGMLHYMVDWRPTLVPEHALGYANEMVDKFEARLRTLRRVKNGRVGPNLKRGEQVVVQANASGGLQQKRRRGWPRKQI